MQPNKPVVLVVDDDPVNLDILVQTLEQDYFLIIAKNGKRALDLAFSHHPDLILLDILMPEMDGFEVCQRLKADKETEGIPVIFLSVMESPGQQAPPGGTRKPQHAHRDGAAREKPPA